MILRLLSVAVLCGLADETASFRLVGYCTVRPGPARHAPPQQQQYAQQKYVEALYASSAAEAGHLGFAAGDVIAIIEQGEPNGWWWGSLNGVEGWFPSTFCSDPFSDAPSSMRAVTLYAFEATQPDELSLHPGDVIDVVNAEEDWWMGTLRGKTGYFPSNFVELMGADAKQTDEGRNPNDQEAITYIMEQLREPQARIVSAVVDFLGAETAYDFLERTKQIQEEGGMITPEGKPRSGGGIFLQLLKDATHLPREAQDAALLRIKAEGKKVKKWQKAPRSEAWWTSGGARK